MRLYETLPTAPLLTACAMTIGTFDGVHRGHQALIETLCQEAARRDLPAALLTFQDMPYCYFNAAGCPRLLTLSDEKNAILSDLGLDVLLDMPFDAAVAEQAAEAFVREELVARLGVRLLVVGPDFALGKGRQGDIPTLRALGDELGFEVLVLEHKVEDREEPISSTRTRDAVEGGRVSTAARLLGRPFTLSGQVVSGRQLGRTIGVPTINLALHPRKVVPAHGIYAARAYLGEDATSRRAALSIGGNPTVGGSGLNIEFHVIGEEIAEAPPTARLELVEWLRDEHKFPSLEALVGQMRRDIARADEILADA